MNHLWYKMIREELRIIPAKVERVRYMQETLICPECRKEDDTTISGTPKHQQLWCHTVQYPQIWLLWLCIRRAFCIYLFTVRKRTGKKNESLFREKQLPTGITLVHWSTFLRFMRNCTKNWFIEVSFMQMKYHVRCFMRKQTRKSKDVRE